MKEVSSFSNVLVFIGTMEIRNIPLYLRYIKDIIRFRKSTDYKTVKATSYGLELSVWCPDVEYMYNLLYDSDFGELSQKDKDRVRLMFYKEYANSRYFINGGVSMVAKNEVAESVSVSIEYERHDTDSRYIFDRDTMKFYLEDDSNIYSFSLERALRDCNKDDIQILDIRHAVHGKVAYRIQFASFSAGVVKDVFVGVLGKKLCFDKYYDDKVRLATPEEEHLFKRKLLFG